MILSSLLLAAEDGVSSLLTLLPLLMELLALVEGDEALAQAAAKLLKELRLASSLKADSKLQPAWADVDTVEEEGLLISSMGD